MTDPLLDKFRRAQYTNSYDANTQQQPDTLAVAIPILWNALTLLVGLQS